MSELNRAQGIAKVLNLAPDNDTRLITEAVLRELLTDLWNSGALKIDEKSFFNLRELEDRPYEENECIIYNSGAGFQVYRALQNNNGFPFTETDWQQITGIVQVSTDEDNAATIGTDGKIFVPQGVPNSGSESLRYIFAAPTSTQAPTPNTLQINNVNPSLVTEIYFSSTAYPNRSVSNILELLEQNDAIYIQQSSDDEHFINANITGSVIDNGTFFTLPIDVVSSGIPFDINSFTNIIIYHAGGGSGGGTETNPFSSFSYTDGNLTLIEIFDNSNQNTLLRRKNLTYTGGFLTKIVETTIATSTSKTKNLTYSPQGVLINIENL